MTEVQTSLFSEDQATILTTLTECREAGLTVDQMIEELENQAEEMANKIRVLRTLRGPKPRKPRKDRGTTRKPKGETNGQGTTAQPTT